MVCNFLLVRTSCIRFFASSRVSALSCRGGLICGDSCVGESGVEGSDAKYSHLTFMIHVSRFENGN